MIEVFRYQAVDGTEPVTDWLQSLRDKQAQAKVRIPSSAWKQAFSVTVNLLVTGFLNCVNTSVPGIGFTLAAMDSVS